jgi:hypothetical protein
MLVYMKILPRSEYESLSTQNLWGVKGNPFLAGQVITQKGGDEVVSIGRVVPVAAGFTGGVITGFQRIKRFRQIQQVQPVALAKVAPERFIILNPGIILVLQGPIKMDGRIIIVPGRDKA